MDTWFAFNVIAGIASIVGSLFSFWQAKKSQSAADHAQKVKDQIIVHKKAVEMSELLSLCQKAQKAMAKFGPASIQPNLRGINATLEAEAVQEFYVYLKQNRRLFGESLPNRADDYCEKLSSCLDNFAQSRNEEELRLFGKKLFILLVGLLPELKSLLDDLIENTI